MKIYLVLLIVFLTSPVHAKHKHLESWYQNNHCKGEIDKPLPDRTRVDCLTKKYAIEYDFATDGGWYEAIGQCLHYARLTGKRPGIVLILERKKDIKYYKQLKANIKFWKLPIKVWLIKNY